MSQSSTRPSVSGRQLRKTPQRSSSKIVIGICVAVVLIAAAFIAFQMRGQPGVEHFAEVNTGQTNHLSSPSEPLPNPYNSNPPTSGWHWGGGAAPPGIKDAMIEDTITVHSLEHGFVIIHYRADLDQDTIAKLKTLTLSLQEKNPCIILEPRPVDQLSDATIAVTSWTYMLKLQNYDENAIRAFYANHVGKDNPEKICPVGV